MTDFYKELELKKEQSLEEINAELNRLENVWRRRETVSPEKAVKMIALIMEAREAFKSAASRHSYDIKLEESYREPSQDDPNADRKRALEKWSSDAKSYFDDLQYDLALTALEKSLSYVDADTDNSELFHLAACIYMQCGKLEQAMRYVNEAIVNSPNWPVYYITKGQIFEKKGQSLKWDEQQLCVNDCRNSLRVAVEKAESAGMDEVEGVALGMLAFSLYFHPNPDVKTAEEYALRAQSLGERANSNRILKDIQDKKDAETKREEERKNTAIYEEARKEEEKNTKEHLEKAASLYESISGWKDAGGKANALRYRIKKMQEEDDRRQEEIRKNIERQRVRAEEERLWKEQQRLAAEKRKELGIKIAKKAAPYVACLVALLIFHNAFIKPYKLYSQANKLMKAEEYESAINIYNQLNGFMGSEKKLEKCYDAISQRQYEKAAALMNEGKYEEAISAFSNLQGYSDSTHQIFQSQEKITELQYNAAVELMNAEKYEEAIKAFKELGDYEDCKEKIELCERGLERQRFDAREKTVCEHCGRVIFTDEEWTPSVEYDAKNHDYALYIQDCTWEEAEEFCESLGGHLATITFFEEYLLVQDMLENTLLESGESFISDTKRPYNVWLGFEFQMEQVDGEWQFISCNTTVKDEYPGMSNWASYGEEVSEPTATDPNTGDLEDKVAMYYKPEFSLNPDYHWVWNTLNNDIGKYHAGRIAFLCEWEHITVEEGTDN